MRQMLLFKWRLEVAFLFKYIVVVHEHVFRVLYIH